MRELIKPFLVLLLLASIGIALVVVWVTSYPCTDPALAARLENETRERIEARDKASALRDENGWGDLSALFNLERKPPDPTAEKQIKALSPFSRPAQAKDLPLRTMRTSEDAKLARAEYEKILPQLRVAFARPHFLWPSQWERGMEATVPNFLMMRVIVHSAVAYADLLRLDGKPDDAVEHLLAHLEWADKISDQSGLISLMIGMSLENILLDELFEILDTHKVSVRALQALDRRVGALGLPRRRMLLRMDEEHLAQMQTMKLVGEGHYPDDPSISRLGLTVFRYVGYLAREERASQNLYLLDRPYYQKGVLMEDLGVSREQQLQTLFRESHSFLLPILAPNSLRAQGHVLLTDARLAALRVLVKVMLDQRAHGGNAPASLDALDDLPGNWAGRDKSFLYEAKGKQFRLSIPIRPTVSRAVQKGDSEPVHPFPPPHKIL